MTRAVSGRSSARLAQAQILRELETTWRNWRAFIAEKRDEIAQRQADEAGVDDLTTPLNATPAIRKARFSGTTRQELATILEQRRQVAQRDAEAAARQAGATPPDVEQVLERLIQRIDDELNGRAIANGNALVWFDGPHGQLVEFDYRTVSSGTNDDDYLAAGGLDPARERLRRMLIIAVVAIFLIGAALLVLNPFGGGEKTATASGPTLGVVASQSTPLWDIQHLAIGPSSAPVSGAALGYPTLVCLTTDQQRAVKVGETVIVSGTTSVRTYTLNASPDATPRDLIVADCAETPPRLLASAAFQSAQTLLPLDAELIRSVTTTGSDADPANIPANQMRVDVAVARSDAPKGTLILADGTRWSPASSAVDSEVTLLSYLVPVASGPQMAGWELTEAQALPGRLALTIPAPEARETLLREYLAVSASGAEVSTRNGAPILTLSLEVTLDASARPITLLPDDLTLTRSGNARSPEWEPPALEPGKPTIVRIVIPLQDSASVLEATLGPWHARLRW